MHRMNQRMAVFVHGVQYVEVIVFPYYPFQYIALHTVVVVAVSVEKNDSVDNYTYSKLVLPHRRLGRKFFLLCLE